MSHNVNQNENENEIDNEIENEIDNVNVRLTAMITASVQDLLLGHSKELINPNAEDSLSADMLELIIAEVRGKLNELEYTHELRSELSECQTLLEEVLESNVNVRQDIEHIRELLTDLLHGIDGNGESDESDDGHECDESHESVEHVNSDDNIMD